MYKFYKGSVMMNKVMNKGKFKSFIAKNNNITKAEAERIIKIFTDSVTSALSSSKDVMLVGFGSFSVSNIKAREGHNPQTGAKIKIPAYKRPKFKAGQKLKDPCN